MMMQLSLFEDIDNRQVGIEHVAKVIMRSDSIRGFIKNAIKNNDRKELVRLFQDSINSFGFSYPNGYSWSQGELEDRENNETYKVTARELADVAIKIRRD